MTKRPQTGSRNSGTKRQKASSSKSKTRTRKSSARGKQAPEQVPVPSLNEVTEKTLKSLNTLGDQVFALFPFSQYFDDWLKNIRMIVSEFETNPAVEVDEHFIKERTQIFEDIEREFAENRLKEASLQETSKTLSDTNRFLAQLDADYTAQTNTLSQKRNSDIERLTKNVRALEEELIVTQNMKTSIFKPATRRIKAQKLAEVNQKLSTTKNELELVLQNFKVEQEKLHDTYINKKTTTVKKVQELEKEVTNIETDTTKEVRQNMCNALSNSIKAFIKRKQSSVSAK